jgi:hypothetical protein
MALTGGIWLAVALTTAGAGGADGRPRGAQPGDALHPQRTASELARTILGDGAETAPPDHFQTDLPGHSAPAASPPPHSGPSVRGGYQTELPRAKVPSGELPLGPLKLLFKILAWTGLGVLAVLLVVWLVRALQRLRWRRGGDAALADDPRAPGPVAIPVGDAEALAAQGSYAEAVHALLLRTLEALSRAARLSPALTSREIVARVTLSPRARLALRGLVYAVEVSRFGGTEPGEEEYRACRERFQEFLATYGTPA